MKVVIIVTKRNVVLAVWNWTSSDQNKAAIERAVAMAVKAGQDEWVARRSLTEKSYTEIGEYRITIAERRSGSANEVPSLDAA